MRYLKGTIFYANLEPKIGSEQGGIRPVIVVQTDKENWKNPTVIIAPLTKKINNKPNLPSHINIKKFGKLKYDSVILLEQIRVLDKSRIKNEFIGRANNKTIKKINKGLEKLWNLGGKVNDYNNRNNIFDDSNILLCCLYSFK